MSTPEKRLPFIQALIAKHNVPRSVDQRRYQSVLTVLYADELAEANALGRDELIKVAGEIQKKLDDKQAVEGETHYECIHCHTRETMRGTLMPKADSGAGHVHCWRRLVNDDVLEAAKKL